MVKSADAFRTISEVADDLDVSQHVLRFWETKFPQIKPLKRGGGRRYYRPEDVELLRAVRHLLYGERYTIRGVQQILRSKGARAVLVMLSEDESPPSSDLKEQPNGPGGPDDDGSIEMQPGHNKSPEPLPDDFFDRPVADPVVGVERWRITTLIEELRACAKILAAAQSRHTDGVSGRVAPAPLAAGHSVDAP